MSSVVEPAGDDLEDTKLTFSKLNLQWWMNKMKSDTETDYFDKVQFKRFNLERLSGSKVKLNIRRK